MGGTHTTMDLDQSVADRWDQLLEAVRAEFWRLPQDPDAVFEPRRDELKLRARIDRPGQDAEWLAVTLTSHQVLNGDLATYAVEFVGLYRRECEGPTNSTWTPHPSPFAAPGSTSSPVGGGFPSSRVL